MNLPNKITVFRILMIPFFVACMLIKEIPYHDDLYNVLYFRHILVFNFFEQ